MIQGNRSHIYFASDFHLGVDLTKSSKERERLIINWLEEIKPQASAIFLVGDIFDYWFEYKHVIPKGYVRLFGLLASMVDEGIDVHYFKGNHDMWVYRYFQEEIGLIVHNHALDLNMDGYNFHITHGDGLGHGNRIYKTLKKVLRNPLAQKLFAMLHPGIGLPIMKYLSEKSRDKELRSFDEEHQDRIITFADTLLKDKPFDFFICGHYHHPVIKVLANDKSVYCNIGDWITHFSYACWDKNSLTLKYYQQS